MIDYKDLLQKAKDAMQNSYAPYSKFNVGSYFGHSCHCTYS